MDIGQNIKSARIAANMTQKQLAEKCGIADSAIRKYESGKIRPKLPMIQKLAFALGVRMEDIIGIESFDTGADFDAKWKEMAGKASDGRPEIAVIYKQNEIQIVDRRKEKLISVYDNLDEEDQGQLVRYGNLLSSQPKYKEPPQD